VEYSVMYVFSYIGMDTSISSDGEARLVTFSGLVPRRHLYHCAARSFPPPAGLGRRLRAS